MIIVEPIYRNASADHANDRAVSLEVDDNYISWFEGQQSTGLWYYKRIIVGLPSSMKVVTARVPENSPFKLYDVLKDTRNTDFLDNDTVLKDEVYSRQLFKQKTMWYHQFYVVGHADEPGEFIGEIEFLNHINYESESDPDPDSDPIITRNEIRDTEAIPIGKLKVGMEVYGENEILRINLQNMGVELSDDIGRSIYETDLYEERPDWVLLNNKWRELLINFMDTIGCKGSYKSLKNCLEWFDYGKLIELRECWKHQTLDGTKLMDRPLNKWLSDWYNKSLSSIAKTTYMVIRQCSVDLSELIDHEVAPSLEQLSQTNSDTLVPVYKPYIYDPQRITENDLNDDEVKWAKDEMRMKMQLLGMFFEKYFMPIHLDLLRASVEDIYFDIPYAMHMAGVGELESEDLSTLNEMIIHSDGRDNEPNEDGFDCVLHLDQQSVCGYDEGLNFGIKSDGDLNIIGVTREGPSTVNDDMLLYTSMSWFNEIGSVAEFEITTPKSVNSGTIEIGRIIRDDEGNMTSIVDKVSRNSDIACELKVYNVDSQGNILNYDPAVTEGAIQWRPGLTYYKQILKLQYAKVNQYGLPLDDVRYLEPPEGCIEWTGAENWDYKYEYYIQTSSPKYIRVNGLGQQIDDTWYDEPPGQYEYSFNLHYTRELYATYIKLLLINPGEYYALLNLTGTGMTYSRKINIKVIDNLNISLEFFKLKFCDIQANPFIKDKLGPNKNMFVTTRDPDTNPMIFQELGWETVSDANGLMYTIPHNVISKYKYRQFLKIHKPSSDNIPEDAPRLIWTAIVSAKNEGGTIADFSSNLSGAKYFYKKVVDDNDELKYIQVIRRDLKPFSRSQDPQIWNDDYNTDIRESYIPEYHIMEMIDPEYTETNIPDYYPIVAVPVIELNVNGERRDLTWSHKLENPAWSFYSFTRNKKTANLKFNIQQPFIASQSANNMPEGRYKVEFQYKWGDEVKTVSRMAPFNIIRV